MVNQVRFTIFLTLNINGILLLRNIFSKYYIKFLNKYAKCNVLRYIINFVFELPLCQHL